MKLIVGLGNPGSKYVNTRHNIGFRVIEKLAQMYNAVVRKKLFTSARECVIRYSGERIVLIQPLSFMNLSGKVVSAYLKRHKLGYESMLVVCDDINLPLGRIRIRPKGSAGGHNGLSSIIESTGTTDFPRLRIGIKTQDIAGDISEFVLSDFDRYEIDRVKEAVPRSIEACECWLRGGIEKAMSIYNG